MDVQQVMLAQLAVDFNTTPAALAGGANLFTKKEADPRKRAYENGDALLQILCYGGIAVCNTLDEGLRLELEKTQRERDGAWFLTMRNLARLDEALRPYGQRLIDIHQYSIPSADRPEPEPVRNVVWFEGAELERFRGDDRFDEALVFNPAWPDQLAVAAVENGEILGMAAASADAAHMWQIGINVLPGQRGRGLGAGLVAMLKRAVLERGILPFYSTAVSHTVSHRVAAAAGFVPAWVEAYSGKLE